MTTTRSRAPPPSNRPDSRAITEEFYAFINDRRYPCVGAKAALAAQQIKLILARSIDSASDDQRLHQALVAWARSYRTHLPLFYSLVCVFPESGALTELQFERAMWRRLQALAELDADLHLDYDSDVSPDPSDPNFAVSYGGSAFFVVGLHPRASRPARRFRHPALVFNLHDQFARLRQSGAYEGMRNKIIRRDTDLSGSRNPMLARHGETSAARQYSGRNVPPDWRCPFQDRRRQAQ